MCFLNCEFVLYLVKEFHTLQFSFALPSHRSSSKRLRILVSSLIFGPEVLVSLERLVTPTPRSKQRPDVNTSVQFLVERISGKHNGAVFQTNDGTKTVSHDQTRGVTSILVEISASRDCARESFNVGSCVQQHVASLTFFQNLRCVFCFWSGIKVIISQAVRLRTLLAVHRKLGAALRLTPVHVLFFRQVRCWAPSFWPWWWWSSRAGCCSAWRSEDLGLGDGTASGAKCNPGKPSRMLRGGKSASSLDALKELFWKREQVVVYFTQMSL